VIAAATFVAYIPILDAGFIWDDDDYVTHNPEIRTAAGLKRIWLEPRSLPQYYPLVHTTYWIEYQLWELAPLGYHLTNILLHASSAVLLFYILRKIGVSVALVAAAVFALHPVHVETVAWIAERKNTLAGLFFFSALIAWMRWRPIVEHETPRSGSARFYWLSLVLFCCALFSKTVTCSLPAMILLLIWWKRGRIGGRDIKATLPFFAAGIVMAMATVVLEKEHVLAEGVAWDFSIAERCLIAGRALWFYATKLVLPVDLCFNYSRWEIDSGAAWQYLFPAAVLVVGAVLFLCRRHLGRGPLVAVLVFCGNLVPALGFFNVYPMTYSFVADHFQYLASASLIVLACGLGASVIQRLAPESKRIGIVAAGVLLALLGTLTWNQGHVYHDLENLWTDTLAKNPSSWLALGNLGGQRVDQGRLAEARPLLEEAVRIHHDNPYAHNNLGIVFAEARDFAAARRHLETALRQREAYPQVHNNLGALLWSEGDLGGAEKSFTRALEIEPRYADALRNLAELLVAKGEGENALPCLEAAVELNPRNLNLRLELAGMLRIAQRGDEALPHYIAALRLQPGHRAALACVGGLLADIPNTEGDPAFPAQQATNICRSIPYQLPVVLDALAANLAAAHRLSEAVATEEAAVELAARAGSAEELTIFQERLETYKRHR